MRGVRGVRLETVRVGQRRYVTRESLEAFVAELNKTDGERLADEGC
jgi:hypothetical protein